MTVYEWIASKDDVIVAFDKTVDDTYSDYLKIQMDIGLDHSIRQNKDNTITLFPITAVSIFHGDQIPNNDADMLDILEQMYQDLMEINYSTTRR